MLLRDLGRNARFLWFPGRRRQRLESALRKRWCVWVFGDGFVKRIAHSGMELPDTIRRRLEDFSRNVLFDQSRAQPVTHENGLFLPHDKRVLSGLHLQMSLYFNMWFFPLWWISETVMLHLKYPALPDYYKFILVTVLILMTLIEAIRLFLGYSGNLQEKVPELAGFWLLSILLQFPLILFLLFNEAILIQPLERAVHIVLALFLLSQALSGFVALRDIVRHTESQFHLLQLN